MSSARTRCVSTKLTEAEYATLERVAGAQTLSVWARTVLLHAATATLAERETGERCGSRDQPDLSRVATGRTNDAGGGRLGPSIGDRAASTAHSLVYDPTPRVAWWSGSTDWSSPWYRDRTVDRRLTRSAAWVPAIFVLACLCAGAIGAYRYARIWTPLQRQYLSSYVWSAMAISRSGSYELLVIVDRTERRTAVDADVVSVRPTPGGDAFGLSATAVNRGAVRLTWQRSEWDHAALHAFLHRLAQGDRVLLVGDVRQHHGVDAGRPYQQLQEAGMETARLEVIVRQRDPALRAVVEQLARGEVRGAVHQLDAQGRVHDIAGREARLAAIAHEYLRQPDGTLIVSPDNRSRLAINQVIHEAQQTEGQVATKERHVRVLVARQEVTGADRQWAAHYATGDVVRYTKGSHTYGLAAGEYARVVQVNAEDKYVTVRRAHGARVTYDPRRLQGVTLYRETDRAFATDDRVQLTAPDRAQHLWLANS
jgi:hypothetical protein